MLANEGELDGVRLLTAETVRSMVGNGISPEVTQARGGTYGWGLANVNVLLDPSDLPYPVEPGEYGWDGSAGTIFWVDPANELVIVLMTQSQPANPDRLRQQFREFVAVSVVD